MKIANINFEHGLFLSPMAGVTEVGFRHVCEKFGAEMCVSEMVSAKGLFYNSSKTKQLLTFPADCKCKVVQLFGNDEKVFAKVVKDFGTKYDVIDLNMGCPAPKIFNNGDGCALMQNIDKARIIIETCVKNASVPITVKFRSGVDENHVNAIEFAKMCEKAGASAITVHARTREQGYSGKADWKLISEIVKAVSIPVIANGDVIDKKTYDEIRKKTNCAGVMIGRGALGKPEIFSEILNNKPVMSKKQTIIEHIEVLKQFMTEETLCKHMRKHLLWYLSGNTNLKLFREEIIKVSTITEILNILNKFFN